jgi:hypothetical protein
LFAATEIVAEVTGWAFVRRQAADEARVARRTEVIASVATTTLAARRSEQAEQYAHQFLRSVAMATDVPRALVQSRCVTRRDLTVCANTSDNCVAATVQPVR